MSAGNENEFANLPNMGSVNSRAPMNEGSANLGAAEANANNSPSLGEQLGEQPVSVMNTNSPNTTNAANTASEVNASNTASEVNASNTASEVNTANASNTGKMPEVEPVMAAVPAPGKKPMTEGQAKLQAERAETLRLIREEYRKVFGDDKKAPKAKVANAAKLTTVRVKEGQNAFMKRLYNDVITREQARAKNKTLKKPKQVSEQRRNLKPIAPIAPPLNNTAAVGNASTVKSQVISPSKEGKVEIQRQVEHLLHAVHKQAVEEATRRVRRIMKAAGASSTTIHYMSKMILRGKESHAAAFLRSACAAHSPLTSPKTAKKRILFANKKEKVRA